MANVVTTAGSLTCANNGAPTLSSSAKLKVSGKPVIPFASVSTFTPYTGCAYSSGSVTGPCTKTTVTTGGQASKLTVGGQAALLDNLSATAGTPPPPAPISVAAGQSKLTAS
jgi:hypothetical protein